MANEEFFEGSLIELDSRTQGGSTGWTPGYVAIERIGSLVVLHVEVTNAVGAPAQVAQLPADFAPGATVTDTSGNFTLTAGGVLAFGGSTAAGALRVCQLAYRAGQSTP